MSSLMHHSDDAPARCAYCSQNAVGPCASCAASVCGDCCTLTEGGVHTWAVCLDCDRKKGHSLGGAWAGLVLFLVKILAVLALAVALLGWLASR